MQQRTRVRLLPPHTTLRLTKLWPHARRRGHEIGEFWRVGYYCKHCGLDTIWLVNKGGTPCWTVDLPFVEKHFEAVVKSTDRSLYGKGRPPMGPF